MLKLERKINRSKSQTSSKPWQDGNGYPLPKALLEIASRKWSAETWENYLQSLEAPQNEILVKDFSAKLERFDNKESLSMANQESESEIDLIAFERNLENLPAPEKLIVKTVYFDGIAERDAAQLLQMSRWSVRNYKQRAFEQLRSQLVDSEKYQNNHLENRFVGSRNNVTAMGNSAA